MGPGQALIFLVKEMSNYPVRPAVPSSCAELPLDSVGQWHSQLVILVTFPSNTGPQGPKAAFVLTQNSPGDWDTATEPVHTIKLGSKLGSVHPHSPDS